MAFDINNPPEGMTNVPKVQDVLQNQTPAPAQDATKTNTSDPLLDAVSRMKKFREGKMQEFASSNQSAGTAGATQSSGNDFEAFKYAVGQQESSGDYKALSPQNFDGDRAYGKYQVKGSNIPAWTKQYLGEQMTAQDFLSNQEAQEKLFQIKANELYKQYGNWNDVASVWFSGRPSQDNTSKDVTGTSVPQYMQSIQALMKQYNEKNGGTSGNTNVKTGQQINLGGLQGTLTTNYGESTKFEKNHQALDIAAKAGSSIPAMKSGKVVGTESNKTGFGNSILVRDEQGNVWRYSHLKQNFVKTGQTVQAGQSIGTQGNSGSTYSQSGGTGDHLDLRVSSAAGKFLNPLSLM